MIHSCHRASRVHQTIYERKRKPAPVLCKRSLDGPMRSAATNALVSPPGTPVTQASNVVSTYACNRVKGSFCSASSLDIQRTSGKKTPPNKNKKKKKRKLEPTENQMQATKMRDTQWRKRKNWIGTQTSAALVLPAHSEVRWPLPQVSHPSRQHWLNPSNLQNSQPRQIIASWLSRFSTGNMQVNLPGK